MEEDDQKEYEKELEECIKLSLQNFSNSESNHIEDTINLINI